MNEPTKQPITTLRLVFYIYHIHLLYLILFLFIIDCQKAQVFIIAFYKPGVAVLSVIHNMFSNIKSIPLKGLEVLILY
jgi:hypothetical protein